ncbi:uncharacterized protein LOC108347171 isoform X5 [Vigna angularis]|uniref:uncharacterized protein LOC108347171 isoform X5 n=1 Tax=Phaseolus angularis TaxID=3914 RepID=UPI0022B448EE|nr:uncharacterized protein LOC108347171 isoform X5 [Vigna angularis]
MEQLVNFIIRPPRAEYDPKSDLLEQEFMLKGKWYQRKDVEIKNSRGDVLQCSHYMPIVSPEGKPLPCVIYCHGNSGCRADASEAAIILLPSNITVFTLDFSGSGISGGEHVTLGWNEKDDLKAVVNYLRDDGNVSLIGLWGRSMGAVTSLMYGAEDPSIAGMVLDSPFSDLVDLMMELVDTYKIRLPKFTVKFAIQYMRRAIQKKAKFDITDLNTIKVAKSCFVPALLGHAIEDDFIQPHHSDRIFEAYMDVWRSMHELGYNIESSSRNKDAEPSASSTINAIEQVRSRRPMSRMEVPSDISSKDERHEHEQEKGGDHSPSPSSMISFELSNGDPFGPHVPAALEDDQYVEYQLDDLAGFPSTSEEEERMFKEAVMESLKDLEVRNSNAEQPTSSVSTVSVAAIEPSDKDASSQENSRSMETESSSLKHSTDSTKSKTTSSASEECETLEGESYSISANHSQNVVSKPSPVPSLSSEKLQSQSQPPTLPPASTGTSSVIESSNTSDSAHSSSSGSLKSSSETDISHNTKATVTVVRNPPGHAMDGLMRRWDFNFFKNK